jgi:hypothetical protein
VRDALQAEASKDEIAHLERVLSKEIQVTAFLKPSPFPRAR